MVRYSLWLLLAVALPASAAHYLPPPDFIRTPPAARAQPADFTCPAAPAPFRGELVFRSKYEGSDAARATLNKEALAAYRQATRNITATQKRVTALAARYGKAGDKRVADCLVSTLYAWAVQDALTSTTTSHTGKAVRKWALASFSSAWLQLQFAPGLPLNGNPQADEVERWLSALATLTVSDWADLPREKINNHSYWAASALMTTAVVTGREDLFNRAVSILRTALSQVDENGFLPNELKRKSRALAYHDYALQPLVTLVRFAKANQVRITPEENSAFARLVARVRSGKADPAAFREKTGSEQEPVTPSPRPSP